MIHDTIMEKITCPFHTNSMRNPDRIAFYDSLHSITFQEAEIRVHHMARWLIMLGAENGDRIGVLSQNSLDYAVAVFAVSRIGASSVLLNLRLTERDWKEQLALAQCKMILCDKNHHDRTKLFGLPVRVFADGPETVVNSKTEEVEQLISENLVMDKEACVIFTSGSKGISKGAILTNGNLYYSALASNLKLKLAAGDCWLLLLPLYHVGGLSILHRCALAGASVYVTHGFDYEQVNSLMDASRITHLSLVPAMLQRLIESRAGKPIPDTVKVILLGGAPAPGKLMEKTREAGLPVLTTYGMTESASQITSMSPDDPADKLSTSGRPLKYVELRIVDPESRDLPTGAEGEIAVKGKTVFGGYLNPDLGENRADDQWLFTGDKGYLDSYGYLTVTGRVDDMFVSGGENIYPGEIEAEAASCASVRACGVIAVDHAQWGKRPVLFVEAAQAEFEEREMALYLKARLPKIKIPDKIISLDRLPRTAIGKTDYAALRNLYQKRYSS
ncbi:MAG: o-succinylbenzoate--CoA ligase [Desulfobacterales bacterium]|nr:o-succinylbenzoate--CoA ligase [Desulfobacterales bacterium]